MEDLLIEVLRKSGYPVYLQGSLTDDDKYPDHFYTFWNNSSEGAAYYNNKERALIYNYDVNFYSCDPEKVYSQLRASIQELKSQGFIISGDGYTVSSDEPTHDGRGVNVLFKKYIGGN